jgi:hypothetical protein
MKREDCIDRASGIDMRQNVRPCRNQRLARHKICCVPGTPDVVA